MLKDKNIKKRNIFLLIGGFIIDNLDLKLLTTLISLCFIGFSIANNTDKLIEQKIDEKSFLWLVIAMIVSVLSIMVNALAWKMLFYSFNDRNLKINFIELFASTNIYKYLPGGIWHLIARLKSLRIIVSLENALSAVLLEPLLMMVSALLWIGLGGFYSGLSLLCWLSPIIFHPALRREILAKLKSIKFSKLKIDSGIKLSELKIHSAIKKPRYPIKALFVELLFIFVRFCGFWCCLYSFSIGNILTFNQLISAFSFAWIVGLIVPAAPGGVGVFEAAILLRVGSGVAEAPFIASLLCYRIISTLADVFGVMIFPISKYFLRAFSKK